MPFDDLPRIYEACQLVPDDYLTASEVSVLIAIAHKPKGCYEGFAWLMNSTRLGKSALSKNIRSLRQKGLIITEHRFAHKGRQQNYKYSPSGLQAFIERVSLGTPLYSKGLPSELKGAPIASKGVQDSPKGSMSVHPYKEYKDNKNDKDERFSYLISDLPESIKELISYAPNVSTLLDSLEQQGKTVNEIKGAIESVDFSNSYKVGGLFIHTLEGLLSVANKQQETEYVPFAEYSCVWCSNAKGCVLGGDRIPCLIDSEGVERVVKDRNGA